MPVRFAIKSGSWSDPTLWDNGELPIAGDDVYANGFTVTIDTGSNVASIRNSASPVGVVNIATPAMTSNSTPSGIANAFQVSTGPAYGAFDQNTTNSGNNRWVSNVMPTWLSYQFPSGKIIKRYAFINTDTNNTTPKSWTFEGSNDGTNWTVLDTQASATTLASTWWFSGVLSNTTSYTYYRINISSVNSGTITAITEFNMTEDISSVVGGISGGTFNLNPGVTLTANGTGIVGGASTTPTITYSGTGSAATINGNVLNSSTNGTVSVTGAGTLRINGNLTGGGIAGAAVGVLGAATVNVVGNLTNGEVSSANSTALTIFGGGTNSIINITGNVLNTNTSSNVAFFTTLLVQAICTINIVGSVYGGTYTAGTSTTRTTFFTTQPCTVNITGGVFGGSHSGVTTVFTPAIILTGASTITVTGNVYGGNSANSAGIYTNGGTCTVIGNIYGGASAQNGAGISPSVATTINLTGNAFGGTTFAAIHATTASPINITGNVNASGTYRGVFSSAASAVSVNGSIRASNGESGIALTNPSSVLTMAGNLFNANNGTMAALVYRMYLTSTPSSWVFSTATSGSNSSLYTTDYAPNFPSVYDVRKNVSYNSGSMIGLMNVPPREAVTFGVPVDNTTGTSALSATSIAQAVWDKLSSEVSGSDSIGVRLKNAVTTETLGQQLASFNNI